MRMMSPTAPPPTMIGPPAADPLPRRSSTCDGSSWASGLKGIAMVRQDARHGRRFESALLGAGRPGNPSGHAADRVDQHRGRRILRNERIDADLLGFDVCVAIERIEDDAKPISVLSERLAYFDAAEIAHVRVDDEHIRAGRVDQA